MVTMTEKVKKTQGPVASKARPTITKTDGARSAESGSRKAAAHLDDKAESSAEQRRRESLHRMLMAKRQEILNQIKEILGHSLTEDEQRRVESAKDMGDQAVLDLDRELGISLLEMQNRKRQLIDEALIRLAEGGYGVCAECGAEISERRLAAVPFAKLCVECQSQQELMEKIEKGEERD